jgi:hypothetical protein
MLAQNYRDLPYNSLVPSPPLGFKRLPTCTRGYYPKEFGTLPQSKTTLGNHQDLTCGYFNLASANALGAFRLLHVTSSSLLFMYAITYHWPYLVIVKEFSTIICSVTPSPWSRPGSSHEDLSLHANTHVHTHVFVLTFRAGITADDAGCYPALDSVTYQASCQATIPK